VGESTISGIAPGEITSSFTRRRYKMATPGRGVDPVSREVIVKIGLDSKANIIKADPEYFQISKSKNEEVRWVCDQDHEHPKDGPCFTVDFEKNDSPFYESQFSSDAPVSGLAKRNVMPGPKIYQYTVRIKGKPDLDPGGGVQQ
jgi:hypothetical protein